MNSKEYHLHSGKKGAALAVRVTPRARKNEIVEIMGDGTVKIRLIAPPAGGKTNEALIMFLAEVLEISSSRIDILAGDNGPDKLVSILDMDPATAHKKILNHLA
jgi:uncharacterized protein